MPTTPSSSITAQISDSIVSRVNGPKFDPSQDTQAKGKAAFVFTSEYIIFQSNPAAYSGLAVNGSTITANAANDAVTTNISIDQVTADNVGTYKSIPMMVNPETVSWSHPKRITRKDTVRGSTFFHFSDTKGYNNDILNLVFNGNTGNIWISKSGINAKDTNDVSNMNKLLVWQLLYKMSREPMHFTDTNGNMYVNHQYIYYRTQLFPQTIIFTGFFDKGLEFEENAASPFNRKYSMSFTVTDAAPNLNDAINTVTSYFKKITIPQPNAQTST